MSGNPTITEGDVNLKSTLFVNTNKVGIGTTNPTESLTVAGNASIIGNLSMSGTSFIVDSNVQINNQLIINNNSNGPALIVTQNGIETVADFRNETNSILFIANNSFVGINTNTPSVELDINGSTLSQRYLIGNSSTYQRIDYNNDGYGYWTTTTGSEVIHVNNTGRLGIGTTNPTEKLHVYGGSIAFDDGSGYQTMSANATFGSWATQSGTDAIIVKQSNGYVGVGTTNPTEKLHLKGDLYVQGNFTVTGNLTYIDTNVQVTDQFYISNDGTGPALIVNQNGAEAIADFRDDGTSIMYLADGGNIGIGTTNPNSKLDVAGEMKAAAGGPGTGGYSFRTGGDTDGGMFSTADGTLQFYTDNTEKVRITPAGYVGIGTTAPTNQLTVGTGAEAGTGVPTGIIKLQGPGASGGLTQAQVGSVNGPAMYAKSFVGGALSSDTSWHFEVNRSSSVINAMTLAYTGYVGIGQPNPLYPLHVGASNPTNGFLGVFQNFTLNGNGAQLLFDINSVGSASIGMPNNAAALALCVGGGFTTTEYMRITSAGYVGIGITNPGYRLSFSGALEPKIAFYDSGGGNIFGFGVSGGQLNYHALGHHVFYYGGDNGDGTEVMNVYWDPTLTVTNPAGSTTDYSSIANFLTPNMGIGKYARISFGKEINAYNCGELLFNYQGAASTSNFVVIGLNGVGGLFVNGGGNVGIGVSNPASKLDVRGEVKAGAGGPGTGGYSFTGGDYDGGMFSTADGTLQFYTDNTEKVRITSAGYVGIGTTNPSNKLSIVGPTLISYTDSALKIGDGSGNVYIGAGLNSIALWTNGGTQALTISQSNGYVGIGTTNPGAKLDVYKDYNGQPSGTAASTIGGIDSGIAWSGVKIMEKGGSLTASDAFIINALANNTSQFVVTAAGAVGIGTTNPTLKLLVRGSSNNVFGVNSTYDSCVFRIPGLNNVQAINLRDSLNGSDDAWGVYKWDSINNYLYFFWKSYYGVITSAGTLFTGQHRCYLENWTSVTNKPDYIGLIIVSSKNNYMQPKTNLYPFTGKININEALPYIELSNRRNQKSCFGVITGYPDPGPISKNNTNEYYYDWEDCGFSNNNFSNHDQVRVNSLGEGAIWVSNINGNLEAGDFITTCEIPGYGMKQDDDLMHNYTVAKITMDCDFNNLPSWVFTRNVDFNGISYICAFVGCTYHCG